MVFLKAAYYVFSIACFGSVFIGINWLMKVATLRKILPCMVVAALAWGMVNVWLHTPVFKGIPYAAVCLIFAPYAKRLSREKEE